MTWNIDDPQGSEAQKCKYEIVPYTRGKGIDLGCGPHKAFPHFIGVDSCKDTELFGIQMQPDLVCEDATKLAIPDGDLDFIFSSHLLEHIEDTRAALTEWWRCIKPGGHLVLYLPHRDFYPNIGQPGANPDHVWDFIPLDIQQHMAAIGSWDLLVEEERDQGQEYSFLQVFRKRERDDGLHTRPAFETKPPGKAACVVRYAGGIGDMVQASGILPELKRQGYRVTMMTTPKGQDILRHDPNVDEFFVQDNDQVPNGELSAFWAVWEKKFDRFINLCESVEGTLLTMPGRSSHKWPDNLRRSMLNQNYGEFVARIADLPYRSEAQFYPSEQEESEACAYVTDLRNTAARAAKVPVMAPTPPVFSILWALAGSSVHKAYPHMDNVIANVLAAMPEAVVIFVGDEVCKILEAGWEDNPRVACRSGEATIRQDLALAQRVDCVVGPETGVLNAVAFEPVAKVVMLSHSTVQNLTLHWTNTVSLSAPQDDGVACKNMACHRLHYGWDFCHQDAATGAASCQVAIEPRRVFDAIVRAYETWKAEVMA